VASIFLPSADSTSTRRQKQVVASEARVGAVGAPQTIRAHRYQWLGPLQAGTGVAVEVDHALSRNLPAKRRIRRAHAVLHKITICRPNAQGGKGIGRLRAVHQTAGEHTKTPLCQPRSRCRWQRSRRKEEDEEADRDYRRSQLRSDPVPTEYPLAKARESFLPQPGRRGDGKNEKTTKPSSLEQAQSNGARETFPKQIPVRSQASHADLQLDLEPRDALICQSKHINQYEECKQHVEVCA
jgi:hypothetical protein